MNLRRLILREIAHRKLNFALGMLGVAAATACLVAEMALLRKHDLVTEKILSAKEVETQNMMRKLEDDYRKIMLKLGFNVLILPYGQSLNDLQNDEAPLRFMPEDYALKLANSKVATINHILPVLTQKVKWPERQRKVILTGVRGEVYIQSAQQKPLRDAVPPGHIAIGFELHQSLNLKLGDNVSFMGRSFKISQLVEERGNTDDITIWMDLNEAQQLLGRPGQINAILALECNCSADRLDKIRAEIGALLPDTRVIELASQAITRAEARQRAASQAAASLAHEKAARQQMRAQLDAYAAVLAPVAWVAAALWVALLTWVNVRERRQEVGILRAIGVRASQILAAFLGKAAVMGILGACLGALGGILIGSQWGESPAAIPITKLLQPAFLAAALVAAPLLSMAAAWLPALWAASQDPAPILQEE